MARVRITEQGPGGGCQDHRTGSGYGGQDHRTGPRGGYEPQSRTTLLSHGRLRWPLGLLKAKGTVESFPGFSVPEAHGHQPCHESPAGSRVWKKVPQAPEQPGEAQSSLLPPPPPLTQSCANSLPPPAAVNQVSPNPLGGSRQASPGLGI